MPTAHTRQVTAAPHHPRAFSYFRKNIELDFQKHLHPLVLNSLNLPAKPNFPIKGQCPPSTSQHSSFSRNKKQKILPRCKMENSWADQWDSNPDPAVADKKGKTGGGAASKYGKKVGEGLEKTKVAASHGLKKVKAGSAVGLQWIKEKYHKTTHKN